MYDFMQKIPVFMHFCFVQNIEKSKLDSRISVLIFLKGIANFAFMHNIQAKMLKLTFCVLPNITIEKLTKSPKYDKIESFPAR